MLKKEEMTKKEEKNEVNTSEEKNKKKVILVVVGVILLAIILFLLWFFNRKFDVTFDLNEKILIEFAKRNIEIPFSQLDVNLYNGGNKKLGKIKTSDITDDMITPHKSEASEEKPVYEIDKVLKEAKKKITSKKKTTAKNKSEKK